MHAQKWLIDEGAVVPQAAASKALNGLTSCKRSADEHNHHTYLQQRIGRVNRLGQFDILASSPGFVKADPYVVSHSMPDWLARPVRTRTVPEAER